MTDWAEDVAFRLIPFHHEDGFPLTEIANALRKVKIDTLREAASMTRADCYVMADKLEKGEPNV